MTPPQNRLARSIQLRFPIFLDPQPRRFKHFHVREKKVGYESYPRSQLSKRTLFGRLACPSAAGSLAIVRFPHFFAPTAPRRPLWSRTRKKSWVRILCREPGCRLCPFGQRHLNPHFLQIPILVPVYGSTGAEGALRRPRGARGARDGTLRRARLRGAPGGCACGAGGAARLLDSCVSSQSPVCIVEVLMGRVFRDDVDRAPPLGASSRVPPVGLGRAGGGRCKGCRRSWW